MFLGGVFSKEYRRPLIFCAFAVVGAFLYGYDGTYFTGILAMKTFVRDYGVETNGVYAITTSDESLLTSIVQAGEFCGALLAGPIGDWGGRRAGFFTACFFVTLGVVLQLIVRGSVPLLGVGRAVLGLGVGITSNVVPLYLSEIPPSQIRGAVVSCWQLVLAIGQVIGASVDQGTMVIDDTASYRVPIALNLAIVLIIMLGVLFVIPESPRWLVSKDREAEAIKALTSINKDAPDYELVVREQYETLKVNRDDEINSSGGTSRWGDLLRGSNRRRLICVVGILVGQQIGGVQFIFSYTTVFLSSIGIASPFLITIVVDLVEVFGVICSFFVVNRFGRRPLLLWSSAFMTIVLLICGALGTINVNIRSEIENQAIAAMIILYVFAFNVGWGPLAWVIASELSVGKNKQKIMSIGTACFWLSAFVVTFTLPYLYNSGPGSAGLNAEIGFIYGGGTLISMVFVYYMIPETRGRTLEEINTMMEMNLPTREWETYVFNRDADHATIVSNELDGSKLESGQSQNEKIVGSELRL